MTIVPVVAAQQTTPVASAPSPFVEREVELHFFDNYLSETEDRRYLASCQRIYHCSCDCNKCGVILG